MKLLHDRYVELAHGVCDLATGESLSYDDLQGADTLAAQPAPAEFEELFDHGRDGQPRWVVATRDEACAGQTFIARVAAAARCRGFVPVAVSLYHRWHALLSDALAERTLLLIARADEAPAAHRALLTAAGDAPRAHVLLTVLDPARTTRAGAVHEARSRYDTARRPRLATLETRSPEVERLLQRAARVTGFTDAGRHAAAERLLRDVAGALERRGAAREACEQQLRLIRLLIERGRADEACAGARHVVMLARQADDEALVAAAVCADAEARLLLDRLTDAEALLRALLLGGVPPPLRARVHTLLACCLLQQRRVEDAAASIGRAEPSIDTPAHDVAELHDTAVVVALGRGALFAAGQSARAALDRMATSSEPLAHVAALTAHLRAVAAAGDLVLARDAFDRVLQATRAARTPVRMHQARLVWLQALQRAGRSREAQEQGDRLRRVQRCLPPLVRRAIDTALRPAAHSTGASCTGHHVQLDAALAPELLRLASDADEDAAAVRAVLDRVAAELQTSRVDVLSADAGPVTTILSVGTGLATTLGARVLDTGLALGGDVPEQRELGVPIRVGGSVIAAVVCRWPMDVVAPGAARSMLTLAAAVIGPRVDAWRWRAREGGRASLLVPELVGVSGEMEEVRRAIVRAARAPFAVLIEGESGTGKELVARAIHQAGARRERRFCDVNCAALPDDLLDSELFGHAKGAFTGAVADRAGLFEEASGGTLFLDEVADLSPRAQAKLLRAIQQQEVRRVGETFTRPVDVRIIAAANRTLDREVDAGRFRQDLMYRLNVIRITIPPLRQRAADIAPLVHHYWERACERLGSRAVLTPAVTRALSHYDWPGNVRELQNVVSALAVAAPPRGAVSTSLLPNVLASAGPAATTRLADARDAFERRFIAAALAQSGGNRARAARLLGVSRQGLAKMLERHTTDDTPAAAGAGVAPGGAALRVAESHGA